jgi:hypothetical protein
MDADKPAAGLPFPGPAFALTHQPPEPPDPELTFLTTDIREEAATALDAPGGKSLEILDADIGQLSTTRRRGTATSYLRGRGGSGRPSGS